VSSNPYAPDDPGGTLWDVAVIGTGMGGATTGYELARRGHRVLFIEKGLWLYGAPHGGGSDGQARGAELGNAEESAEARLRAGRWPRRLKGRTSFGELEFFAPLGCGSGGSTSLYAAALERFSPADFLPRANFPAVRDSTLPESWPVQYDELSPYYDLAEALFRVRGTPDPLSGAGQSRLLEPPPLGPRDRHFFDSFTRLGLHPYRAHVGYEFVEGCNGCAPQLCTRGCKNDATRICLRPALESFGARLLPQCDVVRLDGDKSQVRSIRCRFNGEDLAIRARIVVLAAGAYMSPALLLNSRSEAWPDGLANRSGLVGRNLMFHVTDFVAVNPLAPVPDDSPRKSVALNDFYHCGGEKLGTFQSAGAAVEVGQIMQYMRDAAERDSAWWKRLASSRSQWWRKLSSPLIRLAAMAMYRAFDYMNATVWATIVEDLPYHKNRVIADNRNGNGMRFEYRYPEELRARVQSFRTRLTEALAPHRITILSGDNNLNFGHVCGTCRFGDDPRSSVLDRNNRAHGLSNLYVVDASFFPSSGGTNPSLTIAANALRVAGVIHEQLG
jgi:choline dehydrogenase-like flavoprotein